MSIFEAVKQSVTTRQAAERYGIRVERNGMCRCPFHDDSTPSMKLDRRYYCFGCGATGDVIDFVSRLRGIGSKEAAILLAQDFAIPYEDSAGKTSIDHDNRIPTNRIISTWNATVSVCCWTITGCYAAGRRIMPRRRRRTAFIRALWKRYRELSLIAYLLDELLCGDMQARASVVIEYGEEVRKLEQRMAELAAADEAADQNAGGQYSTADER